jgi:8-oxo-dGTP diphosphatase
MVLGVMSGPGIDFPGFGVGLVIKRGRNILLYRRVKAPEPGHWNIVGGKVDHLEPSDVAIRREAMEETGLAIGTIHFLCLHEYINPQEGHHWISRIYVTEDFTGEPQVIEPDKLPEFGWFDLDKMPMPLSRFTQAAVAALGTSF